MGKGPSPSPSITTTFVPRMCRNRSFGTAAASRWSTRTRAGLARCTGDKDFHCCPPYVIDRSHFSYGTFLWVQALRFLSSSEVRNLSLYHSSTCELWAMRYPPRLG